MQNQTKTGGGFNIKHNGEKQTMYTCSYAAWATPVPSAQLPAAEIHNETTVFPTPDIISQGQYQAGKSRRKF